MISSRREDYVKSALFSLGRDHTEKQVLSSLDKSKEFMVEYLTKRRCPMQIVGMLPFKRMSREGLSIILVELEDEKRIKCNHSPDGLDTWEVPSQDDLVFVGNLRGEDMYATKQVAFLIDGLNDSIKHLQGVIRCDQ